MKNNIECIIREKDYQQGAVAETTIFNKLRNKGFTVEETDRYDWFDCKINDNYLGEVKKRLVKKDTFDTTIIPMSKIREWKKVKQDYRDLILIFTFKDCDTYISYREVCKLIKTDNRIKIANFQRNKGFTHTVKKHLFIPTDLLHPFDCITLT